MRSVFRFGVQLFIVLALVLLVHLIILYRLKLPVFENYILLAYLVNYLMAFAIYTTLFIYKEKYHDQLGFLFLFGSLFKFLIFFVLFQPLYKSDNQLQTIEFTTFFVPYTTCLVLETLGLIKILKN